MVDYELAVITDEWAVKSDLCVDCLTEGLQPGGFVVSGFENDLSFSVQSVFPSAEYYEISSFKENNSNIISIYSNFDLNRSFSVNDSLVNCYNVAKNISDLIFFTVDVLKKSFVVILRYVRKIVENVKTKCFALFK
jgi:hypothetical protein